jgi:hypothetical protein
LAGNEAGELVDVIAQLERLLDLPNLPVDFQAEAAYKWAFALERSGRAENAKEVLSLNVGRLLLDAGQAGRLGAPGRYWVARSMLRLGNLLEDESAAGEAKKLYQAMIQYNLPGQNIATSRINRLTPGS